METISIKCPHCNEEMQAPVGRESIICMFCGEKIKLDGTEAAGHPMMENRENGGDGAKCAENLEFVLAHVPEAYKGYEIKVNEFKRATYHDAFEDYKRAHYAFFMAVKKTLQYAGEEEVLSVCQKIATAFVEAHQKELDGLTRRNAQANAQMNKNMFMAVFVLPAIKEIRNERADVLAEEICRMWGKSFKNSNILASDYDSIVSGFKKKLCYVTTAVCRNLDMGENCETLQLIKEFSDGYLSATEEGKALIEEYYDIAPTLVKRIAKDADAQAKYAWLWENFLAPCVEFIKEGKYEDCREKYCGMVENLKETYIK